MLKTILSRATDILNSPQPTFMSERRASWACNIGMAVPNGCFPEFRRCAQTHRKPSRSEMKYSKLPSGDHRGLSSTPVSAMLIHPDSGTTPELDTGATKIFDEPPLKALNVIQRSSAEK